MHSYNLKDLKMLKFDKEIGDAVLKVRDEKNDMKWCLFGFDATLDDSPKVELQETGDDFDDLESEITSRIDEFLWAFWAFPYESCTKYVLLSWCHKSVKFKQKFPYYNRDCETFIKKNFGYNVKYDATVEDQIDDEEILKVVKKSAGANY